MREQIDATVSKPVGGTLIAMAHGDDIRIQLVSDHDGVLFVDLGLPQQEQLRAILEAHRNTVQLKRDVAGRCKRAAEALAGPVSDQTIDIADLIAAVDRACAILAGEQ